MNYRTIALTTDFGLRDSFVAEMKGVILGINPQITLIDLCHEISPQNVHEAAFVLHTTYHYFPPGTIHIVVVDPRGSRDRPIAVQVGGYTFVGPDNGIFSYVVSPNRSDEILREEQRRQAVHLTNSQYWRSKVSQTFRGRDIFAPVAAHLSLGVPLTDLGPSIDDLVIFPVSQPEVRPDGTIIAHVLYIDRFGNLITDAAEYMPELKESVQIEVAGHLVQGIYRMYPEVESGKFIALIGSSRYLEISIRNGNAAAALRAQVGDEIRIRKV